MSMWDWGRRPPKRPPREHGIKVKQLGATWWSQRWIEALERLSRSYANRLHRGRSYARAGRVHDLSITAKKVTARVTGSRRTPYRVELRVAPLDDAAWREAISAMSREAVFAAELLAGRIPPEIDRVFKTAGANLFPSTERDLQGSCSCPDWANPCKHLAATHYVIGEALDRDPFLLFALRGREREVLLEALRSARPGRRGRPAPEAPPPPEPIRSLSLAGTQLEAFEQPKGLLGGFRFRFDPPAHPTLLLQQLGDPNGWPLEESMADVLAPLYTAAGRLARELAGAPLSDGRKRIGADPLLPASRTRSGGMAWPYTWRAGSRDRRRSTRTP